jgi:hypothetical protein
MCDPNVILGLLLAADAFIAAAFVLLGVAAAANSNLFTFESAPGFAYAALAAVVLAIGAAGAAISQLSKCLTGVCRGAASDLQTSFGGLIATLTLLAAAIVVAIIPSYVPFLGAAAISAIVFSFICVNLVLCVVLYILFLQFNSCRSTAGSTSSRAGTGAALSGLIVVVLSWGLAALGLYPLG